MVEKLLKESIIAEYLSSGFSYREVAQKRGVDYRSLHRWVKEYRGGMKKTSKVISVKPASELVPALPIDVKLLQAELRKARLHNQLLQEVINIAEEELGLPIRKKFGTKQS